MGTVVSFIFWLLAGKMDSVRHGFINERSVFLASGSGEKGADIPTKKKHWVWNDKPRYHSGLFRSCDMCGEHVQRASQGS